MGKFFHSTSITAAICSGYPTAILHAQCTGGEPTMDSVLHQQCTQRRLIMTGLSMYDMIILLLVVLSKVIIQSRNASIGHQSGTKTL